MASAEYTPPSSPAPSPKTVKRKRDEGKRQNVDVHLKRTILERHLHNNEKLIDLSKEYKIPPNTISTWKKNAKKILDDASECSPKVKRMRPSPYKDIELALLYWLKEIRSKPVPPPISTTILKAKAERLGRLLGHEDWTCSKGFLYRFCNKYNILSKRITGESLDCPVEEYNAFLQDVLPRLLEEYEPQNIYNLDETAFFFKALANRTYAFKNEDVRGSKRTQAKDRLSLMLCTNMTGTDKLKPLIIGKANRPACLKKKNVSIRDLKIDYYSNKKGWMTGVIFDHWLKEWNKELGKQRRHVLLILDNAPSHITTEYSNIKIQFLPPNTTSRSQPLDQGILRIVKLAYRTRLTEQYLDGIETMDDVDAVLKNFDFVLACENIVKAWDGVKEPFIEQCFRKAGFGELYGPEPQPEPEPAPDRNIWDNLTRVLNVNTTFEEYALADDNVDTSQPMTDEDIVAAVHKANEEQLNDGDDEDPDDDDASTEPQPSTSSEGETRVEDEVVKTANDCIKTLGQLRAYALRNKLPIEASVLLDNFQHYVVANRANACTKQQTMFSFMKR